MVDEDCNDSRGKGTTAAGKVMCAFSDDPQSRFDEGLDRNRICTCRCRLQEDLAHHRPTSELVDIEQALHPATSRE